MSDDPLPPGGGSYARDAETGALTVLFAPEDPPPPQYVAPDAPDPAAVQTDHPGIGGSYVADQATGDLLPVFQPDTGMDPNATAPEAVVEPVPIAAQAEAAVPQPEPEAIPATPAPDAGQTESPT